MSAVGPPSAVRCERCRRGLEACWICESPDCEVAICYRCFRDRLDDPKAWITGSDDQGHGPHALAVTYEPTGCGKVLYSTFQTSGADASESHAGLMPQERVLLFLIMEITACTSGPIL